MGVEASRLYSPGDESTGYLGSTPTTPSPTSPTSPGDRMHGRPTTFSTVDIFLRSNLDASKMLMYPPEKRSIESDEELEQLCEQITLEEFSHALSVCPNDYVLIDDLRNRYGISATFISQTLRKVSTSGRLKVLGHILRLNSLLPPDSLLRTSDDQILMLLHKTVTGEDKMDAFRILLPHIQNPENYRTRTELQSLTIVAAQVGSISAVKLLCLNYPFCLEQTKQGRNVLVQVARASSHDDKFTLECLLRDFLEMGVCVNLQEPDGYTALHVAVEKEDMTAIQYLLTEGACPTLPNAQGKRPVDLAKRADIQTLLHNSWSSPPPREVSLYHAADSGDMETIEKLVKGQPPISINTKWVHGKTALAAACRVGNMKMVDFLLSLGASPIPLGCYWPDLPAMIALLNGHTDIARKLMQITEDYLEKAGPIEKKTIKMQLVSLLHHCCRVGATCVANMVLNSRIRINPNTEFRHHLAPIHVAAKHGQLIIIKLLLAYRADVNLPTEVYRNLPLHYASFYGHSHVTKFLLSLDSVDVNCMNIQHETPLYCVLRCQLTPDQKNSFVREDSVICLLSNSAILVKPGRRKCELQDFSMEVAAQRWNFLPVETQKLLVVWRQEKEEFPSLTKMCRLIIRGGMQCVINEESVGNIGLPFRLQHFILLKDWFPM